MMPNTGEIRSEVRILIVPAMFRMPAPPWAMAAPAMPPKSACDELTGSPIKIVMMFHRIADRRAEMMTRSVTAVGSTMPVPTVFATAVLKKAPMMFIAAASTTACMGDMTLVETTVAMALAQSCHPFAMSKKTARMMMKISISCMFEDDAFEDIGDVFGAIRGVFEELVNVFPLDDVDRIVLIVDEPAEGVAVLPVDAVFQPVHLDAVLLHVGILLRAQF